MELGPKPVSIYTSSQWTGYQDRLKKTLYNEGATAVQISSNTEYKNYVANYVQENVVDATTRNAILGIVHRLANIELTKGDEKSVYPIINEYKGHDLIRVHYFRVNKSGELEHASMSVTQDRPTIILP